MRDAKAAGKVFTIRDAMMRGAEFLTRHGISSARYDSELLLCHVLGIDRLHLYMAFDQPLADAQRDAARALLVRRAKAEPVAYIVGEKEFMGRDFAVAPGVLIPRPETELLVEWANELLTESFADEATGDAAWQLLELGCGSGCVTVTLADTWRHATITATEVAPAAIELTAQNAKTHGVDERVTIIETADWATLPDAQFHAIIANPPYIPHNKIAGLMSDVREYEPHIALSGGADGMDIIRMILAHAPRLLRAGGFVLLEIGVEIAPHVGALPTELQFVELRKDYAKLDRMALWIVTSDE